MEPIKLTEAEKKLFDNVQNGVSTGFEKSSPDRTIRAAVLRHIILGLPVDEDKEGIWLKAASLIGLVRAEARCPVTGVGISISGAIIDGLLELDAAIGEAGGPLCPLSFAQCHFKDGLSGRHAHFSRLSLSECTFGAPLKPGGLAGAHPTIDLSGAKLDSQLDMDGIRPEPDGGTLWIRAAGLRVGGGINLSRSTLRTPTKFAKAAAGAGSGEGEDAIDLTLAEINGDLWLNKGSRVEGRLKLRGTKVHGDLWLNTATLVNPGEKTEALVLQGAHIDGFFSTRQANDLAEEMFTCTGNIKLTAAEVGRSLILKVGTLTGNFAAPDLVVRDDVYLHGQVNGAIDLERSTIGGSLDISDLRVKSPELRRVTLCLKDGTIKHALRLTPDPEDGDASLQLNGIVDLTGLSCDTLDDEVGQRWGKNVLVRMNHFTYRRTGWFAETKERKPRKPSQKMVGDWLLSRRAEGLRPWRWIRPPAWLPKSGDFWDPWQLRRNWIYQQYDSEETRAAIADPYLSISRHEIYEDDYRPQPFEQAIRVARAEGREDFATDFEMHKQALEWRLFNLRVRWGLAGVAITLAAFWLCINDTSALSIAATVAAWAMTISLMVLGSWFRDKVKIRLKADRPQASEERLRAISRSRVWAAYWLPALLLLAIWIWTPFHFAVALAIFGVIRLLGVLAHAVMRFGFGYLRRPILAVVTLIAAFLIGWWGVSVARSRDMFVIAAAPVAGLAATLDPTHPSGAEHERLLLMGSEAATRDRFVRDVPCSHEMSEPLYALDVLIPIVDLGEESRCEVRRFAAPGRPVVHPGGLNLLQIGAALPDLPLNDHRFWWWMRALYAILGWIIFSLSILTFAQVNKVHAEPPTEHK